MSQPNARERALATIRDVRIIPVIRASSADAASAIVDALMSAGLAIAEVTMTVPNATEVIASSLKQFGDRLLVGAGTVTDVQAARRAIDAGAQFIVTPCLIHEVIAATLKEDVAIVPGAYTPTEVFRAHQLGGDMVKVFPAGVGGAAYLRALRGPFPTIPLVPSGGVTLDNISEMFAAGAVAVGVGSEIISPDAVARRDYAVISAMADKFLAARPVRTAV